MRMRMRLKLLLLVAGAVAAPQLAPAPLGLVSGAARISCFAPRRFAGSTFELFVAGRTGPVQSIAAEPGQNKVDFILDEAPAGSRCYRCRYRSYNGSAWQASELSAEIAVNASEDAACLPDFTPAPPPAPTSAARLGARPWLLPVVLSAAVLVLLAAAAAAAWRARGGRQRAARHPESCWTETGYPTTELCYENRVFGAPVSAAGPNAPPPRPRTPSPARPHFSTFRSAA